MNEDLLKVFIKRVEVESSIHKFLKEDIIYKLIHYFTSECSKISYPKTIENPLEIALQFYKFYNNQYYEIICKEIKKGKIVINKAVKKSYMEENSAKAPISFLMEKKLELWLPKEFESTIKARRNNRIFYESKMLKAIEYELQCEKIYQENGIVSKSILEESKINLVMRYDYDLNEGLVNYLLRYPLANLLSEYLIHDYSKIKDSEICQICLNTNLMKF